MLYIYGCNTDWDVRIHIGHPSEEKLYAVYTPSLGVSIDTIDEQMRHDVERVLGVFSRKKLRNIHPEDFNYFPRELERDALTISHTGWLMSVTAFGGGDRAAAKIDPDGKIDAYGSGSVRADVDTVAGFIAKYGFGRNFNNFALWQKTD